MSKFLLNLHLQNSYGPASPLASLPPQAKIAWPTHLAHASIASSWEYVFPFGLHLSSWPPLPHLSVKRASLVSFVFPTAPADPGRETSAPPLPALPVPRLRYRQDFTAPLIIPPLIPFKLSLNEP
jgi:hypothetical protein